MDIKEYRKEYYVKNREKLRAYQRWYYQKKKKECKVIDQLKTKHMTKTYGEFVIHFE